MFGCFNNLMNTEWRSSVCPVLQGTPPWTRQRHWMPLCCFQNGEDNLRQGVQGLLSPEEGGGWRAPYLMFTKAVPWRQRKHGWGLRGKQANNGTDTCRRHWSPEPLFSNPGIWPGALNSGGLPITGQAQEACFIILHAAPTPWPCYGPEEIWQNRGHGHQQGLLICYPATSFLSCLSAPRRRGLHSPFRKSGSLFSFFLSPSTDVAGGASRGTQTRRRAGRLERQGPGQAGQVSASCGAMSIISLPWGEHRTLHSCTRTGIQTLRQSGIHWDQVFLLRGLKWLFHVHLAEIRSISVDSGFT